MKHLESKFKFSGGVKDKDTWEVIFYYGNKKTSYGNYEELKCRVKKNGDVFWEFKRIPHKMSMNPTKSKASKLITLSKKEHKEYYKDIKKRDDTIDKVLKSSN